MKRRKHVYMLYAVLFFLFACSKGNDIHEDKKDNGLKPLEEEAFAFPGAEGFGRKVTGGRGGRVIKVTNLNDAGAGSLRAAVSASGARIVVFEVSGTIELQSQLNIRNPNITLAGQTAPGDGITLKNYPVVVSTQNVIVRYMRFRMGDEKGVEADALGGFEQKDIMIDHCSMSWSTDECVSFYSNENFTMQWCIISESLRISAHDKGAHGYAGIFGGVKASFHHNLIAHHDSRTPRFGERGGTDIARRSLVDYRNNVIYNWGGNSAYGGEGMHINLVNNYYKPGPATQNRSNTRIYSIDKSKNPQEPMYDIWGKYYIAGNYFDGQSNVTTDNWTYGVYNQFHGSYGVVSEGDKIAMRIATPHNIENNVTTHAAQEAYEKVLQYAGASLKRDAVDVRILNDVKNKTYTAHGSSGDQYSRFGIIDSQNDVGGWPELSSGTALVDSD
ncbi:MAG TPA: pectate lyase, partial [Sphingobacterium sp.]|nr:pectate lyase [Sphingobacterium sp.]